MFVNNNSKNGLYHKSEVNEYCTVSGNTKELFLCSEMKAVFISYTVCVLANFLSTVISTDNLSIAFS